MVSHSGSHPVTVPQEPVVRAALWTMIGYHIHARAEPSDPLTDGTLYWGVAADAPDSRKFTYSRFCWPAAQEDWLPLLNLPRQFRARYPDLWGIGLSWRGGIEAFAGPSEIPIEIRLATLFGASTAKNGKVIGAMIFDPRGILYACALPDVHDDDTIPTFHYCDTRLQTADWVTDCTRPSPVALSWLQALTLDPVANNDVLDAVQANGRAFLRAQDPVGGIGVNQIPSGATDSPNE